MDRKEYLKEWRKRNKEKIKEYNANYFHENKEAINKQRQKHEKETGYQMIYKHETYKECPCGAYLKVATFYMHKRICKEYKIIEPKAPLFIKYVLKNEEQIN